MTYNRDRNKRRKQLRRWGLFAATLAIALVINLPVITMILNSFRTTEEILTSSTIVPTNPSLVNYNYVSLNTSFWSYFANSIFVVGSATLLVIMAAALAGYALSRFRSRVITIYSRGLLLVQMFPLVLALIPLFILLRNLKLVNTPYSVILLYTVVGLPFATWMFKAFFDGIPRELEEAALIDGASRLRAFGLVVLPLAGPAMAAVSIFTFLFSYNEYLVATIFLRSKDLYTIPVGIASFMQQFETDWGSLMAAATMAMVPTFVMFLFVQKYMMYGAVGSGVKG